MSSNTNGKTNKYTLVKRFPSEDELENFVGSFDSMEEATGTWVLNCKELYSRIFDENKNDVEIKNLQYNNKVSLDNGIIEGIEYEDTVDDGVRKFKIHILYSINESAFNHEVREEISNIIKKLKKSNKGYPFLKYME